MVINKVINNIVKIHPLTTPLLIEILQKNINVYKYEVVVSPFTHDSSREMTTKGSREMEQMSKIARTKERHFYNQKYSYAAAVAIYLVQGYGKESNIGNRR